VSKKHGASSIGGTYGDDNNPVLETILIRVHSSSPILSQYTIASMKDIDGFFNTPKVFRGSATARAFGLFRKRLQSRSTALIVLLVALCLCLAVVAIRNGSSIESLVGRETTDDAYIRADQIAISSHIAGYVEAVPVRDNETVKQGEIVALIRDDDYQAKVASAEADLQAAQSTVDVLSAQSVVQRWRVASAAADLRAAEALLKQARLQHDRQRSLVDDGTTSHRELEAAEANDQRLTADRDHKAADLSAAEQTLPVINYQEDQAKQTVKAKQAARDLARIDLGYTRIVSPATGQLSARIALPGQYVTAGTQIGLVVPLPNVWVIANFRETQIAHMHPGQPASLTVDSVPGVTFRGSVDSIGPASGALQALLPPDNATGNFTKIAQRFEVKIILAPGQAGLGRLRPGMSVIAAVTIAENQRERSVAP
jgi:membrane fusion protein, multidrug efflux system